MLQITIPSTELWDEEKQEFIKTKEQTLQLEHSLISLSKWESKWNKAFLSKDEKTPEETLDYITCMTLNQNVDPKAYEYITKSNIEEINKYIDSSMTATCFYDDRHGKPSNEKITSELVYYWMISLNIPFECQKWHINRLLTLVRVCNIKNQPPKKISRAEMVRRNSALNAKRKAQLNTKG